MTGVSRHDVGMFLDNGYGIATRSIAQMRTLLLTAKSQGFSYPAWWDIADFKNIVPVAVLVSNRGRNVLSMRTLETLRRSLVEFCETSSDFRY